MNDFQIQKDQDFFSAFELGIYTLPGDKALHVEEVAKKCGTEAKRLISHD